MVLLLSHIALMHETSKSSKDNRVTRETLYTHPLVSGRDFVKDSLQIPKYMLLSFTQ